MNDSANIADAVQVAEVSILKAFMRTDTAEDATAMWMALSKSVDDSARIRITELGGDVDAARAALDRFSLQNPI